MPYRNKIANIKNRLLRVDRLWWVFVAIVLTVSIRQPRFLTRSNLMNVLTQMSIKGMLALGMTLVILIGEIDLSVGSTLCFASLLAAAAQNSGMPLAISIIIGFSVGGLVGLFIAVLVVYRKLPSFIVTLAFMIILRGASLVFANDQSISGLYASFQAIGQGSILGIPYPIIVFIGSAFVFHFLLSSTSFGARVYAAGSNEQAAVYSGINTNRVKMLVFVIMGVTSALAGFILTARLGAANPSMGNLYELDAIAAVIIGGTLFSGGIGGIHKTLPGIFILGILPNVLNLFRISPFYHYHLQGSIIILAYVLTSDSANLDFLRRDRKEVAET